MNIGPYSPHDLRRTMTTRMAELQVTEEVRERVINHTSQSVQARRRREAEHVHFAGGKPARVSRPAGYARFRLAVTGGHEHRLGRARLEHAL